MIIQFFIILPSTNTIDWKCEIPIKDDVSFYTIFPQQAYRMNIHGKKVYQNKSIIHVLFNDKNDELINEVAEFTGFEYPFSVENYQETNTILSEYIDAIFCPRFEDIFSYYPELKGTESVDDGEDGFIKRDIIQTGIWSGNPIDHSIFEPVGG